MRRPRASRKEEKATRRRSGAVARGGLRSRQRRAIQIAFALGPLPFAFCLAPAYEPARRT